MERHPHLLLDDRLVRGSANVRLRLGKVSKDEANPLFTEEYFADPPKPWEVRIDNMYPNALRDPADGRYKLWYTAFIKDERSEQTPLARRPFASYRGFADREMGVLYACSEDGLRWRKPELGLVEFAGNKRNNLVMRGVHGAGVFLDERAPRPERRYKMIMKWGERGQDAMAVSFSPDGLHWTTPTAWPEHNARGDTHNNAFYDERSGKYVAYTRTWRGGVRVAARTESEDFVNWRQPVGVLEGLDDTAQVYSMPVFPYGDVYLGFPAIFRTGDPTASDDDRVTCELAWSPDTIEWRRICPGQPYIPLGTGDYPSGEFDCGTIYASAPVIRENEMRIYYGGSNGKHTEFRETSLAVARCGLDRFAGYAPADAQAPGYALTRGLRRGAADTLFVTADLTGGGRLRAAVTDGEGNEIPGYALEDCEPLVRTCTDEPLRWQGGPLPEPAGGTLAFRFELVGAGTVLYSFLLGSR